MAVTGGPSRRPMDVVFPRRCDRDAVVDSMAIFPHVFVGDISGSVSCRQVVVVCWW